MQEKGECDGKSGLRGGAPCEMMSVEMKELKDLETSPWLEGCVGCEEMSNSPSRILLLKPFAETASRDPPGAR